MKVQQKCNSYILNVVHMEQNLCQKPPSKWITAQNHNYRIYIFFKYNYQIIQIIYPLNLKVSS